MRWDFVYEEEHYDLNGYCSAGVLSDGERFLFFTVSSDEPGLAGICRIYSSISFCSESLECQYPWTAENDEMLINCLNRVKEDEPFCGEDGPIRRLQFITDSE